MAKWLFYTQRGWVYPVCENCKTVHNVATNYCPECGEKMVNASYTCSTNLTGMEEVKDGAE